jgi:hypothetical protein
MHFDAVCHHVWARSVLIESEGIPLGARPVSRKHFTQITAHSPERTICCAIEQAEIDRLCSIGASRSLDCHFFQNGFAISPSTSAEKPTSLRWSCENEAISSRER